MNRKELKTILERERVNPRFYSISGLTKPPIDEQCVLQEEEGKWLVYYYERGERNSLRVFESEDEACRYFVDWVVSDPDLKLKPT
jgi:hypothetical protein